MKHRIFIAISIPEDLQKSITELQIKLQKFDWPVNWTLAENLHVTLRYIGLIDTIQLLKINELIKKISVYSKSFSVSIHDYLILPDISAPHIIALKIIDNEKLLDLQADIANAIEEQGIGESERFPFTGHITLGRMEPARMNFRGLKQVGYKSDFIVKSIEVMKSELTYAGPHYSMIESFPLL
jgi:RNA 2',3'-cyclic 3'-phosphodiesterase